MNAPRSRPTPLTDTKGSALLAAIFFVAILAILSASLLKYSASEERGNERNRLILRAKNMAENISIYASEQLTTKLYRLGSAPSGRSFPWSGTSRNRVWIPPDSVLTTGYTSPTVGMEMRCAILTASAYTAVTDITDPNYGLYVSTAVVPVIAKATATLPALGSVSAYVEQDMSLALTPLFQFGMFYNMDLELFPGANMTILGPVHTNGRLMARGEIGGTATLTFTGRVTAAEGLYADGQLKCVYVKRDGSNTSGAGGTGAVNFANTSNTLINIFGSSTWRDHKYGTSTETTTTQSQFKVFATNNYTGNVRTNVHGVTKLELPAIGTYKEVDDASTTEDDRNNGRQIIEPPNPSKYLSSAWTATTDDAESQQSKISWRAGLYIVVNPDPTNVRSATLPDGTSQKLVPNSYRCWLNTINSNGSHTMNEVILPGQPGYGYSTGATSADSDDFMYVNNLPNKYTTATAVGSNQVLRTARSAYNRIKRYNGTAWIDTINTTLPDASGYATTGGSGSDYPAENAANPYPADAYFFDLRRANGNKGYTTNIAGGSARGTTNYAPRGIAKIDFDMTRFKMMCDRTLSGTPGSYVATTTSSTVYNPDTPTATNWANSIYNSGGAPVATNLGIGLLYAILPTVLTPADPDPFRLYFAPSDPLNGLIATAPGTFAAGTASLTSGSAASPWYDGIAIYVHSVDAEVRAQTSGVPDRIDSGVRLWNGRGPVASLATVGKTGFTFCTNDAAYIIGHFNADGTVNASTSSTGNAGYSAQWPDSANEMLAAVMADAITLLSQPTFNTSSTPYYQDKGWNDALSAFRVTSASWAATWRSAAPSGTNSYEGLGASATAIKPGAMPNSSTPGTGGAAVWRSKLPTVNTEYSTALLMGMVPSNHNATGLTDGPPISAANGAYSGGAHNFPRLLEDWHNDMGDLAQKGTYIRGSMVALFESRVAMEPYSMRYYAAPFRYWGLHQGFVTAHDLPLEPIVLNNTRQGFKELSPTDYATMKGIIEGLTALP